jgi:hypothetical protein
MKPNNSSCTPFEQQPPFPYLLLNLGEGGDVREVALVVACHPLGRLQVRDLPPYQVGEHPHRLVRLVVLLHQGESSQVREFAL